MEDIVLEQKRGKRRRLTTNAINRQKRIAKLSKWNHKNDTQPHRWAKKHAMDCGRTRCIVCGNPRRIFKQRTLQEEKWAQVFLTSRGTLCDWDYDYE